MPKLGNGPLHLNDSCQIAARALAAPAFAGARWRKHPKHFASCRVHKMDKGASRAGHCFVLIPLFASGTSLANQLHMKPHS